MTKRGFALLVCLCTLGCASPAHATTYDFDISSVFASVQGTISTDGTLGSLSASDVLNWDLTLSEVADSSSSQLFGPLSGDNSYIQWLEGPGLIATSSGLTFDFSSPSNSFFEITSNDGKSFFDLASEGDTGTGFGEANISVAGRFEEFAVTVNDQQVGTLATTPVPKTLPLFGCGLGLIAWRAWHTKRNQSIRMP
jgi:hypothetical protein